MYFGLSKLFRSYFFIEILPFFSTTFFQCIYFLDKISLKYPVLFLTKTFVFLFFFDCGSSFLYCVTTWNFAVVPLLFVFRMFVCGISACISLFLFAVVPLLFLFWQRSAPSKEQQKSVVAYKQNT